LPGRLMKELTMKSNKVVSIVQIGPLEYDVYRSDKKGLDGRVRLETPELGWVLDVFQDQDHQEAIELGVGERPDWDMVVHEMFNWGE